MSQFDLSNITPDENRIAKIVMSIAGVGVLLALGVVIALGWRNGGAPFWNPCRPEIVTLARWILDAGLVVAAFVLGLPEPSRTPNLRVLGPLVMFFVILIAFGVSGSSRGGVSHGPKIGIEALICLILPVVSFGLGNLIRIISTRT